MSALKEKFRGGRGIYSFNKTVIPFPQKAEVKAKPPEADLPDSSKLLVPKELSPEEQAIEYMSTYKKFERAIVCNFYTGGGVYTRGMLDSIYRGSNPLNP